MISSLSSAVRRSSCRPISIKMTIRNDRAILNRRLSTPTYTDAIKLLNTKQSGYKVLEERRRLGLKMDPGDAMKQMRQWLQVLGYSPGELNRLNIVHVAGTKGKGTTCAYTNSILQHYQDTVGLPRKIGLYTSPHLVAVRERIRINSKPISEEMFAKYFFQVWHTLEGVSLEPKPSYFRFMTLLSFHVFMQEGVDAAIYETGVGGEMDSTNIIEKPLATAITTLGIDHVKTLGDTVDLIAWHKAGILKNGSPSFTTDQVTEAMAILQKRATEKGVALTKVIPSEALGKVAISPAEDFQKQNASLAVELATVVLNKHGIPVNRSKDMLPTQFVDGLEGLVWRGRCETKTTGKLHWHLDGAHNEASLKVACSWFGRSSRSSNRPKVLIFNQQSTRDARALIKHGVYKTIYDDLNAKFDHAIFCTDMIRRNHPWGGDHTNLNVNPEKLKSLALQRGLVSSWSRLDPSTQAIAFHTIEEAVQHVRGIADGDIGLDILVTGSFHLLGGLLSYLEGEDFALASISSC